MGPGDNKAAQGVQSQAGPENEVLPKRDASLTLLGGVVQGLLDDLRGHAGARQAPC